MCVCVRACVVYECVCVYVRVCVCVCVSECVAFRSAKFAFPFTEDVFCQQQSIPFYSLLFVHLFTCYSCHVTVT